MAIDQNKSVFTAESIIDLEKEPILFTILIRYNNSYVIYDDLIKSYINITAFISTEDLMTPTFNKTISN